jgi:hypothetical protein
VTPSPPPAPAKPASLIPAPPRPIKARRRPYLVALGVALIVLGALAMVFITSTLGQTRPVLAVTTTVSRGQVIEATDLAIVDLPAGPTSLKAVPSSDMDSIVGQVATTELLPGGILTPKSYTEQLAPNAGTSIVGVALAPEQMPTTVLHAGDKVRIVATPANGGELVDDPLEITATVISTESGLLGGQTIVNVQADSTHATQLAALSASGRVALVIDPIKE